MTRRPKRRERGPPTKPDALPPYLDNPKGAGLEPAHRPVIDHREAALCAYSQTPYRTSTSPTFQTA